MEKEVEEAAKEMMSSVEGERREAFASVFVCTAPLGTMKCDFANQSNLIYPS